MTNTDSRLLRRGGGLGPRMIIHIQNKIDHFHHTINLIQNTTDCILNMTDFILNMTDRIQTAGRASDLEKKRNILSSI